MSATIGDGLEALALAGGIVGYLYVTRRSAQKRLEIIHQERLAGMGKGIPLPEFPLVKEPHCAGRDNVVPILGTILLSLSVGAMIVLYLKRNNMFFGYRPCRSPLWERACSRSIS